MKPARVVGLVLASLYLLAAAGLVASDLACEGMFCGFGLVAAGVPWTLLFADPVPDPLVYLTSVGGIVLNSVILFFIPAVLAGAAGAKPPR